MVRGSRVLVALVVTVLLLGPAVAIGLGHDAPSVTYVPDAPRVTQVPEEVDEPQGPPSVLRFAGLITFSDPTDTLMGHDPVLWRESCHVLALGEGHYRNATLALTDGMSEGNLEDLNLYAWDEAGELVGKWDDATDGLGTHHAVDLPHEAVQVGVCLKGGARASYDLTVA